MLEILAQPLQLVYKSILNTGEIPLEQKRATITPYTRVAPGAFRRTTVRTAYITFNKNTGKNIY